MEEIKVNLDNLTNEERETLLKLVKKGNKSNKKRWRSKENDKYYTLTASGEPMLELDDRRNSDGQCYKLGNYFNTRKEAEFARNKQLIYQQLKDYALEHTTEEFDWTNPNQFKWFIRYDNKYKRIIYTWTRYSIDLNQIYFTSEKIARDAVEEVGEDNIKKYLFGVNE